MSEQRKEFPKDIPVEEGEIDAYMDADKLEIKNGELLTYLKRRLAEVNHEYKVLMMQRRELEGSKRDNALQQIRAAFTENYKARKYIVLTLREMGEKVDDKFVAG